jgi:hypothetical protein
MNITFGLGKSGDNIIVGNVITSFSVAAYQAITFTIADMQTLTMTIADVEIITTWSLT